MLRKEEVDELDAVSNVQGDIETNALVAEGMEMGQANKGLALQTKCVWNTPCGRHYAVNGKQDRERWKKEIVKEFGKVRTRMCGWMVREVDGSRC